MHQAELQFGTNTREQALSLDAERLCHYLKGRGTVKGRQIQTDLGWDEKYLRDVRAATNGAILSGPGFPGYCLMTEARVALPRQAAMTLMREHGMTWQAAADYYGKDHCTALYAAKKIYDLETKDDRLAASMQHLRETVAATLQEPQI